MEEKTKNKQGYKRRKVTEAPDPIRPVGTWVSIGMGVNTKKPEPQPKPLNASALWTINGDKLIEKWGVNKAIIEQFILEYGLPVRDSVKNYTFNSNNDKERDWWIKSYFTEGPFERFLFRPCDIEEFEMQYGDVIEELKKNAPIIDNKHDRDTEDYTPSLNLADYIKQQRTEGKKDEIIAHELHNEKGDFKLTYAEVARELGLDKELQANQHDALKQRGKRVCEKGKAMLVEIKK